MADHSASRPQWLWDLRSDTATKPSMAMLQFMMVAKVGDDGLGEDPTVKELEARVASLCGKEAALMCASSTMSNQVAIRTHLRNPPESVLCHWHSHVFQYESGGAAFHSQAMMIPVAPTDSVNLTAQTVEKNLVLDTHLGHKAPTGLIALENTLMGAVMPLDDLKDIGELARKHRIPVHVDGARLWNASVASGVDLAEYCRHADSINLCLSKGMGAPVGALLVGSTEFINKARHFRKLFGGAWRQAGLLAAAGLYAIDHIWPTMKDTHALTRRLADGLVDLGFSLVLPVETNMVLVGTHREAWANGVHARLVDILEERRVLLGGVYEGCLRIVLHHQISDECVDIILAAAKDLLDASKH
ncbi:Threonine aldolase [Coemansia sp. RSA 552]|nr:Threonine aldolase [Coemansia sp. RSA 552]